MARGSDFASLAGYEAVMDGFEDLLDQWTTREEWVVGSNVEYSIYVHEGTSRMEGRPFLADAVDEVIRQVGDKLADDADDAEDLVRRIALELEGETKQKITEYGAVDTGTLRSSVAAIKVS